MTQSARDLEITFARAWMLLVRNPVIVVPGIVIGVIAAVVESALRVLAATSLTLSGNGSPDALDAANAFVAIVLFVVTLALSLVQMAYITGMAGAAWRHDHTSLGDGWDALAHRLWPAAGAATLLLVIGFCAAALAPFTFAITLLIYATFFIYTMAAVIIGERPPIAGIVESASTALANLLPTLAVVALIAVTAALGGWLGSLVGRVWELGGALATGLIGQVVVSYATLVIAGEYLKLTHTKTEL
ncbi:MAG: hypothetical protein WBG27_04020 [Candidatus Aquilonibacter sp.]